MKLVSAKEVVDAVLKQFEIDDLWFQDDSSLTVESPSGKQMLIVECERGVVRLVYLDFNPLLQIEIVIVSFVHVGEWETIEISFSPSAWDEFLAMSEVFGLTVSDEIGVIDKTSFSHYWAGRLLKSSLLESGILTSVVFASEFVAPCRVETQAPLVKTPERGRQDKKCLQLALF